LSLYSISIPSLSLSYIFFLQELLLTRALRKMMVDDIIDVIICCAYGTLAFLILIGLAVLYQFISWKFSVLNEIPGPIKE
jgi:hypothetical protein